MRTTRLLARLAAVALVFTVSLPLLHAQADQALAKASAAYYAALVSSARGSIDATNRQLLLLASRWDAALRQLRAVSPQALNQDPEWARALDKAGALLARARELARARDIAGAHAELEEMRLMLHEIRERHNLWSFDDHLAEFHEAVERVTGHTSSRSEINFTPKDYQDVDEDLRAARASWDTILKGDAAVRSTAAWQQASRGTSAALQDLSRAVSASDRAGVARAGEQLKTSYFDLLLAISKARM